MEFSPDVFVCGLGAKLRIVLAGVQVKVQARKTSRCQFDCCVMCNPPMRLESYLTSNCGGRGMKIGVAGYLPSDWRRIDTAATQRVVAAGFSGAHAFINKPLEADPKDVARVKRAYEEAGLVVAQTNGWYECLISPDQATRAEGIRGMQALVRIGKQLDTRFVYVRPGSITQTGTGGHTR